MSIAPRRTELKKRLSLRPIRKPILMSPALVKRAERLARSQNVSFTEIVRRAVETYEPNKAEDLEALGVLAQVLLESTESAIKSVDEASRLLAGSRRRFNAALQQMPVQQPQ